jgi:type II secretory pathway pseudopilin PulG
MLNLKNLKNTVNKSEGFTAIELLTGIAILGAVAYLVLPLIFPSDSKTPEQYVEEDLTNVSEVLKIRTLSAEANNIPLSEVYIGNIGVFSSKAQIRHAITINLESESLQYCLRGEYRGKVLYFESGAGLLPQPSGAMECPGAPVSNSGDNTVETEQPNESNPVEAPVSEIPAEDPNSPEPESGEETTNVLPGEEFLVEEESTE